MAQDDYCAPPASARRQEPVAARHSGSHTLSSAPFEGSSEARDAYRAHSVQPRSSPLRAPHGDLPTASLPFEGRTTAQDDFVAPPPVPAQPLRAPGNGAPRARGKGGAHAPPADTSFAPSGRFEGASESREAYKRYDPSEAPRRQPIRPAATDPRSSTKFEGQATSRADYLPPPADALVRNRRSAPAPEPASSAPFRGHSEAQDAYPAYDVAANRRPPVHPRDEYHPTSDDRDWRTAQREAFTEKKPNICPVTALPKPPLKHEDPRAWRGEHVFYNPKTGGYN